MAKRESQVPITRCAIYTRKSTEEGLEQEFNSLDAQRESAEAYIKSQVHEGWVCLPDRYDDGGFSGGNMERPALKRLFADIEVGKVDAVVVYKVDRLSRSLLDFAKMVEKFERHRVSLVSISQLINSGNSMGRLMLNVLLSFAQFEREIISERTRDKIAATRRKGKWAGGMPILGYDVVASKLAVNEDEAIRVRAIFELYLEKQSLIATVKELDERGWRNKQWTTRKGAPIGGRQFDRASLYRLLSNVAYVGKVRYKNEVHPGEHIAIVPQDLWQRVHSLLTKNARSGGADVRNRFGALLKGILDCGCCNCAMSPAHSTKRQRRYRYYVCMVAQKRGWHACPTKSVPADQIEKFVVEQIKCVGRDPDLIAETIRQVNEATKTEIATLSVEMRGLDRDLATWNREVRELVSIGVVDTDSPLLGRLADLQERIRGAEQRSTLIREQIFALERDDVDGTEVAEALAEFDPLWETLSPREKGEVVRLLVERVVYNGVTGDVAITFHPSGLKSLAAKIANREEYAA